MSDEDVITLKLKHIEDRIDDLSKNFDAKIGIVSRRIDGFDDHVRNGIKAVLLAAVYVLWEPIKRFWEAMR